MEVILRLATLVPIMTLLALALPWLLLDVPAAGPLPHRWLTDYAMARQAARDTGKPIFVVFRCEH